MITEAKHTRKDMKKKKASSLKSKMLFAMLASIGVSFGAILILFSVTTKSLEKKTMESLITSANEINTNIESIIKETKLVSESVANEQRLIQYLDEDYTGRATSVKNAAVMTIQNSIFEDFNRSNPLEQLAAIYNVPRNELFNFIDYKVQNQEIIDTLLTMGVTDRTKLSMYFWYPLQDNFLSEQVSENIRENKVVFGSRRIYSSTKLSYPYVHIFALKEQQIYDCYKSVVEEKNAQIYVLTAEGKLLSSSEIEAVESGIVPQEIVHLANKAPQENVITTIQGKEYFVSVKAVGDENEMGRGTDWVTVISIPKDTVLLDINQLYISILLVMLFCIGICSIMIIYLYKKFMNPISALGDAMKKVDGGDLQAYLDFKEDTSETSQIISRYNLMLKNINVSLEEQLRYEAEKQDLDMQVLTSQIDPHFLYNTLETIVWKANEANRADIGKIASSLGKVYRLSVNGGKMWTTIEKELEHVKSYIEIQKVRYGDSFEIQYEVQKETLGFEVPKLILQPIVENIFLHAVSESENIVKAKIIIKMVSSQVVQIKILDNGPGISQAKLENLKKWVSGKQTSFENINEPMIKNSGIGLRNIYARLNLYMGKNTNINLYSKKGIGTKVVIFVQKNEENKN